MPKLRSGRHVALEPSDLADLVDAGTPGDTSRARYRGTVSGPRDLIQYIPVMYFEAGKGEPPDAPAYPSGFRVGEVLAGEAEWTAAEIAEFREWLDANESLREWLAEHFDEIDGAIRESLSLN